MNYLIKGGEFNNKGAEAMTLIALYNVYKNDSNANVFILKTGPDCPFELVNHPVFIEASPYFLDLELGCVNFNTVKIIVKDFLKLVVPWKKSYIGKDKHTQKIVKKIDVMIDISGYALSSKWGHERAVEYINWIKLIKQNGATVWLMPQSFGPFNFDKKFMDEIISALSLCDKIYAREKGGFKALTERGLENVDFCYDSVLIEHQYSADKVIQDYSKHEEIIPLGNTHNIAIVPNYRLIEKGNVNLKKLLDFYEDIICRYLIDNYSYYLIAHCGEDLSICREIKNRFKDKPNVVLIDHVLYSFNYERIVCGFDYIIASRYHSIVHAFRQGTPCAIIGWSEKYDEIARAFNQEKYIIDAHELNANVVVSLDKNYEEERRTIRNRLCELHSYSCYSFLNT